jgi:hypothetical protein
MKVLLLFGGFPELLSSGLECLAQPGKLKPIPLTRLPKARANEALHMREQGRLHLSTLSRTRPLGG